MSKLLYIEVSPRKERSSSITVAQAFLKAYSMSNPEDHVKTIDLWDYMLPEFDGDTIDAKYQVMHGVEHSPEQAAAWKTVADIANEFKDSDKYVFSMPMWNFGICYKLKHYIDVITQPGILFDSGKDGYKGHLGGKPVLSIYARAGEYSSSEGAKSYDFQRSYFEHWLKFVGFTESDMHTLLVEPTAGSKDSVAQMKERLMQEAVALVKDF